MTRARYTDRSTDSVTPTFWSRSTGPTDGRTRRTDVDRWLSTRDNPRFRNAHAHIRNFPSTRPAPEPKPRDLDETRRRADQEAEK